MGRIKKLKETDLVGGAQSTDVYPITSTLAVYDGQNKVLESYLTHLRNTATFGGIATPTTNPGTPTSKVFYIAKEKGTYQYFGKVITEDEVIILLWDSIWRKLSTGIPSKEKLDTKQDIIPDLEDIRINANKGATALQPIQNITYAELVALRNSSSLVAGMQYRIIDYITTTAYTDTISAGHQFDIIVIADNESTLNEAARAIQHEGDTYFANSNLSMWQIWYCLDNVAERYTWADTNNGKGVIYRMIDEFNNDCPYDFKNIQFRHPKDTNTYTDYYYTFNIFKGGYCYDKTVTSFDSYSNLYSRVSGKCYGNIIKPHITDIENIKYNLNFIIFLNKEDSYCYNNSFGYNCYSNSFGDDCFSNSFGNDCSGNSFGDDNYRNSFGNNSNNNSFSSYCSDNSLGNNCSNNSLGFYCSYNSFSSGCYSNSLGSQCNNNSFGFQCSKNSFGPYSRHNSFGANCHNNSFRVSANTASALRNYVQNNHFDDGCSYNVLWNSSTTSSGVLLKNININRGVAGTSSSYNMININTLGQNYEIQIANNSKGEIKIYCEADLIA